MPSEVWSYIETEHGKLGDLAGKMAAESCRTAGILGMEPCVVVIGGETMPDAIDVLKWYGLRKIYFLDAAAPPSPEIAAQHIGQLLERYPAELVLFADTSFGAEAAARLAAFTERGLVAGCTDFELEGDRKLARKPVYKGKADALVAWLGNPPHLATVQPSVLEASKQASKNEPEVVRYSAEDVRGSATPIEEWEIDLSALDLSEASVVIGVGRGVKNEFMEEVRQLALALRGVIGGTRIAVFESLVPTKNLIGTTGKWLYCDLYIALGISGAPQHVMGIKDAKETIAINLSKDAPILKYAKLGVVGDIYDIVPKVLLLLKK